MPAFHILTQFIWPDAAPTGLYAEHLGVCLQRQGHDVRLTGGQGAYRPLKREKPDIPLFHLNHYRGRRGNYAQTFAEYESVRRAFHDYIAREVRDDDVVIVTSAPPTTVSLAKTIRRHGARSVYWLQDYYPELIRGVKDYPVCLRQAFSRYWDGQLARWDRVVKIGANLAGPLANSVVIRNWPTLKFENESAPEPGTALYSGNLGYGHHIPSLVDACERLWDEGYKIDIHADGRGMQQLPAWLNPKPLHHDPQDLKASLVRHEIHLIVAHPKIRRAVFPSKIWNSIALGRRLICSGFAGEMASELQAAQSAKFEQHLDQWTQLLMHLATCPQPVPSRRVGATGPSQPGLEPAAIA